MVLKFREFSKFGIHKASLTGFLFKLQKILKYPKVKVLKPKHETQLQ